MFRQYRAGLAGIIALVGIAGAGTPIAAQAHHLSGTAVVSVAHLLQMLGSEFVDAYLALSPAERDRLLMRLADERSMQLLAAAGR